MYIQNLHTFFNYSSFENVICEMSAVLSRPQFVNPSAGAASKTFQVY